MWLSGQFQDSLFFLRKDFECTKNAKSNNFHLLRSFCARKIVAFAVFCWFIFVFIGWFWLNLRFCALKNFFVKKIDWLEIVLITSYTIILTCTHPLT